MSTPPPTPAIFHITPVTNLSQIIASGGLVSDSAMIKRGGPATSIGMASIKQRRLTLPVSCHRGLHVGDCVPFYFCARSVMLYVIHCANQPGLSYRGGQDLIVHLQADLHQVVAWATRAARRWAFSPTNAGARYTQFFSQLSQLNQIDWAAVRSTNFASTAITPSGNPVKEMKAAEFLVEQDFPWDLVQHIGVASTAVATQVNAALASATHKPQVSVQPSWYF